jgi:tellurite resistance-related uncharacterized protein
MKRRNVKKVRSKEQHTVALYVVPLRGAFIRQGDLHTYHLKKNVSWNILLFLISYGLWIILSYQNVPLTSHCLENPTVLHAVQSRSSDKNVALSSHCFENLTVLHVIQSWSSDQNVPLSSHCFENPTVLHVIQSRSSDKNVALSSHCFENPTVLHVIQSWSSNGNVPLSFHFFENPTILHTIQSLIVLAYFDIHEKSPLKF